MSQLSTHQGRAIERDERIAREQMPSIRLLITVALVVTAACAIGTASTAAMTKHISWQLDQDYRTSPTALTIRDGL